VEHDSHAPLFAAAGRGEASLPGNPAIIEALDAAARSLPWGRWESEAGWAGWL